MRFFEMVNWELKLREEVWTLDSFNKILKRDKTKDKSKALKEMAFIYHYTDVRSTYSIIDDNEQRIAEIKRDVALPEKWEIDEVIEEAIEMYRKHSYTITKKIYEDAVISANAIGSYLRNTDKLLFERDDRGKPVTTVNVITAAINQVNKLIKELKILEKEVIKEEKELEGRTKGSKTLSIFEDGLDYE